MMPMVYLDSALTMGNHILDPSQASITMAKLQNPVKSSFDSINESLKESHSSLNKYSKALDKVSRQTALSCIQIQDLAHFGLVLQRQATPKHRKRRLSIPRASDQSGHRHAPSARRTVLCCNDFPFRISRTEIPYTANGKLQCPGQSGNSSPRYERSPV